MIGEDTLLRFGGVPLGEACTIVIRGATQQILDEAERSLHDALCVLAATVRETRTVYGGGKLNQIFVVLVSNKTKHSQQCFQFIMRGLIFVLMAYKL